MGNDALEEPGTGHLIRRTEDVSIILLEAPQPCQAPQAARGLGPVQGPEVRQAQGQLSPGSGPMGEHQAEDGVAGVSSAGNTRSEDCSCACPLASSPCIATNALCVSSESCQSHASQPCLAPGVHLSNNNRHQLLCPSAVTGTEVKQEAWTATPNPWCHT